RSKQDSKRKQFTVKCIWRRPPQIAVSNENRSTIPSSQATFCGTTDLPRFAAPLGMGNKAHLEIVPRRAHPSAPDAGERLEGWKQIAAYLKRDVRTVQRWEKTEQFPVRRLMHRKLGSVLAFKHELDRWMEQRCVQRSENPATPIPVYELYLK